jgi:4-alpha-glucanotransferase
MTAPFARRSSGLLLHPTSLPGPFSCGDIGPGARKFIDFLKAAGQKWWQMLPVHPPGGCDSPYDSPSAFAGSDLLISLEDLVPLGLLTTDEIRSVPRVPYPEVANFLLARRSRSPLLVAAFARFQATENQQLKSAYDEFLGLNDAWVWDYGLFASLRLHFDQVVWTEWEVGLRHREPEALRHAHQQHREEVLFQVFCQFLFHYQWGFLRNYAAERGIRLMGDIPMFVSHDSADVWANQRMFFLDGEGRRTVQAGVPPDYFSEDGQLWGNPLYRWDVMQADGYGWWIDRLRRELHKFDAIRLDHFIAFSRYWEVPMGVTSAKQGRYVNVPGYDFLERAAEALGGLPFVAEDLGIVTREVETLRDHFDLPGMKVLQFAFSPGAEAYLPHRHPTNCVAYLGTHDNNTTRGWFESLLERSTKADQFGEAARVELARLHGYTGVSRTADVNQRLIRTLFASPANTVLLNLQDLLDQGDDYRMNVPGVADGNWTYRITAQQLTEELASELKSITIATERA